MLTKPSSIEPSEFTRLVDSALLDRSGRLFYSAPSAFRSPSNLYLLGLNPGGSPIAQADETIGHEVEDWPKMKGRWSAYLDERWVGSPAGTHGMQPRIRHMFDQLGMNLRDVPASNVVFVRSNDEAALASEKQSLLKQCWPVHQAVIEALGVSTVLCLGGTAGQWVRSLLGTHERAARFVEGNSRGWASEAHLSDNGMCVITVTHPGRADWRNPLADPMPLVREMLAR